mgnify:CR=1 FL=1
MTNDPLAKALFAYFADHGTPNERLRAHYIINAAVCGTACTVV